MTPRAAARKIVDEIVADLSDRRGFDNEWDRLMSSTKREIVNTWLDIAENWCKKVEQTDQEDSVEP